MITMKVKMHLTTSFHEFAYRKYYS